MNQIISNEITFHPHSTEDCNIRLFYWKGELYRGINTEQAIFVKQLFQEGLIQKLVEQELLIESELNPLENDQFDIVVKHRTIPFNSYSIEWCAAMIKDAALTLIDVAIEAAKHGYGLEDGHLGNVIFDGYKPIFIDLGSIKPLDECVNYFRWKAIDEFFQAALYPMILMSQGKDKVARLLMVNQTGVQKSDLLLLTRSAVRSAQLPKPPIMVRLQLTLLEVLPSPFLDWLRKKLKLISEKSQNKSQKLKSEVEDIDNAKLKNYLKFLEKMRQDITNINLPFYKNRLSNQFENSTLSLSTQDTWTAKQIAIYKCLNELKPASVLDIGCNTGWYSKLAVFSGSKVVAFDKEPTYITQLYYEAREEKLPILPLVMDFTQPTPSYGLSSHRYVAATERFQCDMVLALGLVHHIVYEQKPAQFEPIVKGLALFSKRWLIVEFVPIEDSEISKFGSLKAWYKLENFIRVLKKHFSSIHTMPSHPEPRVLLLCEK